MMTVDAMIREVRHTMTPDDDDELPVWVDSVEYDGRGTVAVGRGHTDDGRPVTFAGSPGPLRDRRALRYERGPVRALVPPWALL